MPTVLGIDQSASNTGMCLWDVNEPLSTMRLHSFKADGYTDVEKVESYRDQLIKTIFDWKPDFIAFEEPLKHIQPQVKRVQTLEGVHETPTVNAHTALLLNMIAGATIAVILGRGRIPYRMVRPATWRKSFLGYTTSKDLDRHGFKNWKQAAMAQCERFRIPARNQDQAEAAGIAFWASGCDEFKMMKARAA